MNIKITNITDDYIELFTGINCLKKELTKVYKSTSDKKHKNMMIKFCSSIDWADPDLSTKARKQAMLKNKNGSLRLAEECEEYMKLYLKKHPDRLSEFVEKQK